MDLQKKIRYDYFKFRYLMHTILSILDFPILIVTYWLGYYTAFNILLILMILNAFIFADYVVKTERKLYLE